MSEIRVLIRHATEDTAGIEAAYRLVSEEMAMVPGQLGNELLRGVHEPTGFVVVSRWRDMAAFTDWEAGAEHRDSTAPLRRYRDHRDGRPFEIFRVSAAY